MNKVILAGRLTADPDIRYTSEGRAIASYRLAVDRITRAGEEKQADFIPCVAFGKSAEFAEKYFRKGTKLFVCGRLRIESYVNRDGTRAWRTDVIIDEQEFAESKAAARREAAPEPVREPDFMAIPEGDGDLPFNFR